MLYDRLTKKVKIHSEGKKVTVFHPSIKVRIYSQITKEDYDASTWEYFENEAGVHRSLYEFANDKSEGSKVRPKIGDYYALNSGFDTILLYDEEVIYGEAETEEMNNLGLNEYIKTELLEDNELVIIGYPTQYLMTHFINNPSELENIVSDEANDYDSQFYITDYQSYNSHKMFLKFENKDKFTSFLQTNNSFILLRDIFLINSQLSLGNDFAEDELNIVNNLRRNIAMDRYVHFYIKLPNGTSTKVNLDNLIMNPTYKKALENIFENNKIGIQSKLWNETIEAKLEIIYKTKFALIHIKVLNFNLSYEAFESNIEAIKDEIKTKQKQLMANMESDMTYFDKFQSKTNINRDNWDSDKDLFDEANKKAPVVLVIGPPLIGKTSVTQKLCKDLDMVNLDPMKFFESIFAKVAEFEEKMANWNENEGENNEPNANEEEGEAEKVDKTKVKKKKKPEVDIALTSLEYAVYRDITTGNAVSVLNMQRLYSYLLHSDLAISRGIVIDLNSNINKEEGSFAEKILNGYYGKVIIDYVIDLTIDKEELEKRRDSIRFNLRNLNYISPRDIEIMKKPKVAQKEILEDEIEQDEEGKDIIPEPEPEVELGEEELEKIPKDIDLLEVTDFFSNFQ